MEKRVLACFVTLFLFGCGLFDGSGGVLCVMMPGMNANKKEDILSGNAIPFFASRLFYLILISGIAVYLLRHRDVNAWPPVLKIDFRAFPVRPCIRLPKVLGLAYGWLPSRKGAALYHELYPA